MVSPRVYTTTLPTGTDFMSFRNNPTPQTNVRSSSQPVGTPAAFVVESLRLPPLISKYGLRGLRFALLELGAAAVVVDLVATALGLSTLWLGGFVDEEIWKLLSISPLHELEVPFLVIALGHDLKKRRSTQTN